MRKNYRLGVSGAALLGLLGAGCSGGSTPRLSDATLNNPTNQTGSKTSDGKNTVVSEAEQAVRAANTRFAFALFDRLAKDADPTENVFVSPSSVAFALALIYNGVGGETRSDVGKTLRLDDGLTLDGFNAGNTALRTALASDDPQVQITTANALWANQGVTFAPDFLQRARQSYGAEAATLNFSDPAAAETINGWVREKTKEKIKTLFDAAELAKATSVLANAVYFKGKWTNAFDKKNTRDGAFTLADGTKKTLPMMSRTGDYRILRGENFEAIRLPFGKGAVHMVVLLPEPSTDLKTFVAGVTTEKWEGWMTALAKTPAGGMVFTLPRFKVEYKAELNAPLGDLGMASAFASGADFSPMGLSGDHLGLVRHKAVMEVNEEGAEAAAVTGGITVVSVPPSFTADRPFLCAIRDEKTGTNLFLGAITNPE